MSIQKVLIIGGGGNIGPAFINALLPNFSVTVLSRQSSTSTFPSGVQVTRIADSYPHAELVQAFRGQDAVIAAISAAAIPQQKSFIDAAIEAGVKRFVPNEFGSDSKDERLARLMPMVAQKKEVREYVEAKAAAAAESGKDFSYTAIICSAFLDWGLPIGFFRVDAKGRKATVVDSGDDKFAVTNLGTVAQAVALALQKAEETRNKTLFVQGMLVSFNEIVERLEKITGAKFDVTRTTRQQIEEEGTAKMNAGNLFGLYDLLFAELPTTGDFSKREDYGNDILGLKGDDVEATLQEYVKNTQ